MQMEFDFGLRRRPFFLSTEEVADRFFRGKYKAPRGAVQHAYYLLGKGCSLHSKFQEKHEKENQWGE
jgi:hypothetical protein